MTLHDDRTFVRHFSWVIVALIVITIFFIFISFLIVGETGVDGHSGYTYVEYTKAHSASAKGAASQMPQGGQAATAATMAVAANNGKGGGSPNAGAIWEAHCSACHATGVAGAPKIGDKKAWGPILAQTAMPTLYKRAINGYKGSRGYMPPRGGAATLTDTEVKAAASYMIVKSGGVKTSAAAKTTTMVAAKGGAPNGEAIWEAHCSACHATGVAGAPKIGDKQAWGPILVKTTMPTLYKRAINGYKSPRGFMPPKGGASGLSDARVMAAVDYMVGKSGGGAG